MKRNLILLVFLANFHLVYNQDYDLIIKTNGDSLACLIDRITENHIHFEMKNEDTWIHTYLSKSEITDFKYKEID